MNDFKFQPLNSTGKNQIIAILTDGPISNVTHLLEFVEEKPKFIDKVENYQIFESRAISDTKFMDAYYPIISNESKKKWLLLLLNDTNLWPRFNTHIENSNFEILYKAEIGNAIIEKINTSIASEILKKQFESLDNLAIDAPDFNIEAYKEKVLSLLESPIQSYQELGRVVFKESPFLHKNDRISISDHCLDWIKSVSVNHPNTLNVIYDSFENTSRRDEYISFLFGTLFSSASESKAIELAIEILHRTHPSYIEFETTFIDLKERLKIWPLGVIKTQIIEALKKLKSSTNKKEANFWNEIDKVSSNDNTYKKLIGKWENIFKSEDGEKQQQMVEFSIDLKS